MVFFNYLSVSYRVVKRPLAHSIKIPTHVFRVELWLSQWIVGDHVKSEQANVGGTLDVLTQYVDAAVCAPGQTPRSRPAWSTRLTAYQYVLGGLPGPCQILRQEVRSIACKLPAVKGLDSVEPTESDC